MPRADLFNPAVVLTKTAHLQGLQEAVAAGYVYYVQGTVAPQKALALAVKFAELYGLQLDKNARYRRKKAGLANAMLQLRQNEELRVDFALLLTPGEHVARHLEKFHDARAVPMRYQELELVRLTRKGSANPAWTWRWHASAALAWRERVHLHTARNDARELFRDWYSLYRIPGFAGVRRQVGDLVAYWRREWCRLRGTAPCPMAYSHNEMTLKPRPGIVRDGQGVYWTSTGFPSVRQLPMLYYVRKQKDAAVSLKSLVQAQSERA